MRPGREFPGAGFPGIDLTLGVDFWTLLPAFVVVTLVGGVKNMGDCVAVQQTCSRRPRATDFRAVQGSLNTNGLGILFAGLAGTPPTTVYSATSVSLHQPYRRCVPPRRVRHRGSAGGAGLASQGDGHPHNHPQPRDGRLCADCDSADLRRRGANGRTGRDSTATRRWWPEWRSPSARASTSRPSSPMRWAAPGASCSTTACWPVRSQPS